MDDISAQPWIQSTLSQDELPVFASDAVTDGRIWQGFMTARLMVALLLLALQALAVFFRSGTTPVWLIGLCVAYAVVTLATRLFMAPAPTGQPFEPYWPITVGLDLLVYFLLVWFTQGEIANYLPLLALPPVICAVLGNWRTTLFTALLAALLIGIASWKSNRHLGGDDQIMRYAMVALYVLATFLLTSMLHRMARNFGLQQLRSQASQQLLRLQERIQDMVAQSVNDGVVVIAGAGRVRAINQAAKQMLHVSHGAALTGKPLHEVPELRPLSYLINQSFADGEGLSSEVLLFPEAEHPTHLMVRTRLSLPASDGTWNEPLCLLYLEDMQALQERVRMEKLAAMGRMSAAVAHEIRNPLAAIGQASQLLNEEIDQPLQKQLNSMIQANVQRLGRIVSDVLDIARMQQQAADAPLVVLDDAVQEMCKEWQAQHAPVGNVRFDLQCAGLQVKFDPEHLRRVLVNLLDNAQRHGQQGDQALVIVASRQEQGMAQLMVWSRGAPLPGAVQARLFEPFAAGPSRSTGLGLYICRELCQRYQGDIHYHRIPAGWFSQRADSQAEEGNAFVVLLPVADNNAKDPSPLPHLPSQEPI